MGCARAGLKSSSFWRRQNRDIPLLISGAHLFLQSLYFEPMRFGAQVMNNVLWLRGKFLLFAYEMEMCESSLLQRLRVSSSSYTWKVFNMTSVVYCRIFLPPELQKFLYVDSSTQTLADRERSGWGKYKQIKANKAVCGELCLWWHHRNAPWVRDLVKSKHNCQALKDPIRCVRRHVIPSVQEIPTRSGGQLGGVQFTDPV